MAQLLCSLSSLLGYGFFFVWVWMFLRCHKMGVVGGCFLQTVSAAYVDAVWLKSSLAHATWVLC